MKSSDLLASLDLVKTALATKPFSPALTHFCFTGKKVQAYNGELYISAAADTGLELSIPGEFLYKFVSTLKKDVTFKIAKNNLVTLTSGKLVNKLQGISSKDFTKPETKKTDKAEIKLAITEDFINSIKQLLQFAGEDRLFPQYIGIVATSKWLYATNGRIIARADTALKLKKSVFLPKSFCNELVRLCGEVTTIKIFKDHILAEGGTDNNVQIVHSRSDLKVPDCKSTFAGFEDYMNVGTAKVSDDLLDCIARLNLVATDLPDKNCVLKFDKNSIELDLDNKSFSHLNEKISAKGLSVKDEVEILIPSLSVCSGASDKFGLVDNGTMKALYFLNEELKMDVLACVVN